MKVNLICVYGVHSWLEQNRLHDYIVFTARA